MVFDAQPLFANIGVSIGMCNACVECYIAMLNVLRQIIVGVISSYPRVCDTLCHMCIEKLAKVT